MPKSSNPDLINLRNQQPPVVLAFGALDPVGGGGLQADIETAASLGCHCAPVATALCTSGGPDSTVTLAVDNTILIEQARSVLEEMAVAAIKIGFAGSVANAEAIHSILRDYPHIPVVLHPALNLWDQDKAEQSGLLNALSELLLPQATVAHMTLPELRQIAPEADTVDASAQAVINRDCDYLLVCDSGQQKRRVQNSLYRAQGLVKHYQWEQVPSNCHSSASTLASSVAAYLAHNCHPVSAIEQGQSYTWQALVAARQLGSGTVVPHRFFWADQGKPGPGKQSPAVKSMH